MERQIALGWQFTDTSGCQHMMLSSCWVDLADSGSVSLSSKYSMSVSVSISLLTGVADMPTASRYGILYSTSLQEVREGEGEIERGRVR